MAMQKTRRTGKAWMQQKSAELESADGKVAWVMSRETTDIYEDGVFSRTVPTNSLFKDKSKGFTKDFTNASS